MSSAYDELVALYQRLEPLPPVEPIRLTREQFDWVKTHVPTRTSASTDAQMWGIPIHVVDDAADSTPVERGWTNWPGVVFR